MSVPDIDVSSLRERLRKVDASAEAVARRVKFLREDYAADGAGVDADLIEALAAELVVEKADNQFTRDARIAHLTKCYGECVAEKEKNRTDNRISADLRAQLAAVKAEREELVEVLKVARKEIVHEVPYSLVSMQGLLRATRSKI